ncbi:hypothetical protein KGD82_10870 [Nocardiopsis eucommiae]|uniref:Uncharacterized protein n=1 Tax=Nocardiopsis eucommiae TaxID=2831970 RepID=A0A975LCJ2_9ACTN|nr:hypothetical protein KGD82_10870 [Nocardiopsis eucommiae]
MRPDEDDPVLPDTPRPVRSEEEVVDHDILADILRDAIGVLSRAKHEERSRDAPDHGWIEVVSEQQVRLSKALRDLYAADTDTADRLRAESLAIIDQGPLPSGGHTTPRHE